MYYRIKLLNDCTICKVIILYFTSKLNYQNSTGKNHKPIFPYLRIVCKVAIGRKRVEGHAKVKEILYWKSEWQLVTTNKVLKY